MAGYEELRRQFLRRMERPLDGLERLVELRLTLARVERRLVDEARRNCSTWDEIGRSLGISRQAAHSRHRLPVNRTDGA